MELQTIENLGNIRAQLLRPKKVQLHSGLDGFNSPNAFGIYRESGGDPLGVVGDVFEPMNLDVFMDAVEESLETCGHGFDLSKLEYKEYKGGRKVAFEIPSTPLEIKSKLVGDVIKTKLRFITGFDGLTKMSLSFSLFRLWCENGAGNWKEELALRFKNTINNQAKVMLFCDEIGQINRDLQNYKERLDKLCTINFTQKQLDEFMSKMTGYEVKELKDLKTRQRNILDRINESVAIEQKELGSNLYALLQGVTRYTTHDLAGGSMDKVLYDTPDTMNKKAHKLVFEMAGIN